MVLEDQCSTVPSTFEMAVELQQAAGQCTAKVCRPCVCTGFNIFGCRLQIPVL